MPHWHTWIRNTLDNALGHGHYGSNNGLRKSTPVAESRPSGDDDSVQKDVRREKSKEVRPLGRRMSVPCPNQPGPEDLPVPRR